MGARVRRTSTALLAAALLALTAAPALRTVPPRTATEQPAIQQMIGTLEGGTFWTRLACVGCIGLIVGAAVELTPIAVLLAASSGGTMTAGCAFACTIAML